MKRSFLLSGLIGVAVWFAVGDAHSNDAGKSGLCVANEKMVFGCRVKGGKHVSVCTSMDFGPGKGWIQYRFGKPGAVEMLFPTEKKGGHDKFHLLVYTSPQHSDLLLDFENAGVGYAISQGNGPAAIAVTPEGKPRVEIPCVGDEQGTLFDLQGSVVENPWMEK